MKKNENEKFMIGAKKAIQKAGLFIAGPEHLEKLADAAADAYRDYPLHLWFMNGKYDYEDSKLVMLITLKTMLSTGLIYSESEELNGFTVWMPPGFTGNSTFPFIANGGLKLIFHSGIGTISKLLKYESFAMGLKKKYTNNEDCYLYNLSVRASAQGKGIASKLLRPMLNYCAEQNKVVYLETNKSKNVDMYKHFGFELCEEALIPGSSVNHYAMLKKL